MNLAVEPVRVAAEEGEGLLVFADGRLAAVLVRLSAIHAGLAGRWFLEATFGLPDSRNPPVFEDLDEARHWIAHQIEQSA